MKEAYGELYKIEISLRILIHEVMTEEYGPGWLIKALFLWVIDRIRNHSVLFIIMNLSLFYRPTLV